MRALVLSLLVAACGSAPAPVASSKPPPAPPAPVVVEQEEEPEPEPLATEDVSFEQSWAFVSPRLTSLTPVWLPEAELVKRLPLAVRAQYRAVSVARKKYDEARRSSMWTTAKDASAREAAADRARKAFERARDAADKALEKSLSKKPTGEVAIALSRLRERGGGGSESAPSRSVRYGSTDVDSDSVAALEPLEDVLDSTSGEIGRWVRIELVHHLMATDRAASARPILEELVRTSPPDRVPQLLFRIGLLHALAGDDAEAAARFRSAHDELAQSSGISRFTLLAAELFAHYRSGKFERALAVAREAWDEGASPAPVKPDPNPPPPPPPPKPVKRKPSAKSKATALLAAREYGMLGLLSSAEVSVLGTLESSFDRGDVVQLATDCVERLGLELDGVKGPKELRAGIASRLAARALYRNDDATAKALAEKARELGGGESREGLRVLRVLAARAGEDEAAKALDQQIDDLPWAAGSYGSGQEHSALDQEIRRQTRPKKDAAESDEKRAPGVERNVRSLIRLCLEPVYHRMPREKTIDNRFVAEISLKAIVYPEGRVELKRDEESAAGAGAVAEVLACAQKLAPRVLARAPSSVDARISVKRLDTPSGGIFGELSGDDLGRGFGGLGTGGLIGIGSGSGYGVRGSGSGGGGTGTGTIGQGRGIGGLGSRGLPSTPKKKPQK